MKEEKIMHGANIFEIARTYGFAPEEIKDFSSNVNPLGPSPKGVTKLKQELDKITVYPDMEYHDLKESIVQYTSVHADHIILGTGTTGLIQSFIHYVHPKRALLIVPCYSEYERELKTIDAQIFKYPLQEKNNFQLDIDDLISFIHQNDIEFLVLTNPNNPTATGIDEKEIGKILDQTKVYLMVDETYIEFTDVAKYTAIRLADTKDRLLVLRSTSKFYAAPGIRLGYGVISDPIYNEKMTHSSTLWNINIFADILGTEMFADTDYQQKTFSFVKREKEKMITALRKVPALKIFDSISNFVLCKIENGTTAKELREHLMTKKLVIRDCQTFEGLSPVFFRFCILDETSNQALIDEITKYFEK